MNVTWPRPHLHLVCRHLHLGTWELFFQCSTSERPICGVAHHEPARTLPSVRPRALHAALGALMLRLKNAVVRYEKKKNIRGCSLEQRLARCLSPHGVPPWRIQAARNGARKIRGPWEGWMKLAALQRRAWSFSESSACSFVQPLETSSARSMLGGHRS